MSKRRALYPLLFNFHHCFLLSFFEIHQSVFFAYIYKADLEHTFDFLRCLSEVDMKLCVRVRRLVSLSQSQEPNQQQDFKLNSANLFWVRR